MNRPNTCRDCGGDYYHYSFCDAGEHGVLVSDADRKPWVRASAAPSCHHCDVLRVADVPDTLIAANHAGHTTRTGARA